MLFQDKYVHQMKEHYVCASIIASGSCLCLEEDMHDKTRCFSNTYTQILQSLSIFGNLRCYLKHCFCLFFPSFGFEPVSNTHVLSHGPPCGLDTHKHTGMWQRCNRCNSCKHGLGSVEEAHVTHPEDGIFRQLLCLSLYCKCQPASKYCLPM